MRGPLLSPEKEYELEGNVSHVVFPTGTVQFDRRLYVYYGAADTRIAAFSVDIDELIREIKKK